MKKNSRLAKLGDVITVGHNSQNGNCLIFVNGKKIGASRVGMLLPFQVARNYVPKGCEARFLPFGKYSGLGRSFKVLKSFLV